MLKILIASAVFLIGACTLPKQTLASTYISATSATLINPDQSAQKPDERVLKLRLFFASYDSPLEDYAPDFVTVADKYGIDWKMVTAITGVESTFGKFIPRGSFNAYGWVNGNFYFQNWPESIEIVTRTIKEKYIDRGADTVWKIGPIYAPPSKTWASKVNYFMETIENFDPDLKDSPSLELSL